MAITNNPLGYGPILPFKRGSTDLEAGEGELAAQSTLAIIFGTSCSSPASEGEVEWNQALGNRLEEIKHKNMNDPAVLELARYYSFEAVARNAPWIVPTEINFEQDQENFTLKIRIKYDLLDVYDPSIATSQDLYYEVEA